MAIPAIISFIKRLDVSKKTMAFQKKTAFMKRFRIVFKTFSLTKKSALPLYFRIRIRAHFILGYWDICDFNFGTWIFTYYFGDMGY